MFLSLSKVFIGFPMVSWVFRLFSRLFQPTTLTTLENRMFGMFLNFEHVYTVFHEESESEVEKCQILEPGGKIEEKPTPGIPGSSFLSLVFRSQLYPGGYEGRH